MFGGLLNYSDPLTAGQYDASTTYDDSTPASHILYSQAVDNAYHTKVNQDVMQSDGPDAPVGATGTGWGDAIADSIFGSGAAKRFGMKVSFFIAGMIVLAVALARLK